MNKSRIRLQLDQYKPLREIVFEGMRDAIIKQVLKPGERLMENHLARDLDVSRTPIREALRRLELEGFVYVLPRKGVFVSEISLKDIHNLYEIREALEILAVVLATERATQEEIEEMERCVAREKALLDLGDVEATVAEDITLHNLIYKASRNERLLNILNNLREQIYRMRLVYTTLPGQKKMSQEMHGKIVAAIKERDLELAQKLAKEHIVNAAEAMIGHYQSRTNE